MKQTLENVQSLEGIHHQQVNHARHVKESDLSKEENDEKWKDPHAQGIGEQSVGQGDHRNSGPNSCARLSSFTSE